MTPAEKLLTQIEAQVRLAREALAEEHEGDFKRAVLLLGVDSDNLITMAMSW